MRLSLSLALLTLNIGSVVGHDEDPSTSAIVSSNSTLNLQKPDPAHPARLEGSLKPKENPQPNTTAATDAKVDLQLWFYQLILDPEVPVLRQESTLIVPATPPDKEGAPGFQALWPAVLPEKNALLQNVLTTVCHGANSWCLLPYYCCRGAHELIALPGIRVYPGDKLTNIYVLDASNGKWFQNWVVSPGVEASSNRKGSFGGGLIFDPKVDNSTDGMQYTRTAIALELQSGRVWNFGNVEWRNIIVEAKTNKTDWCLKPILSDVMESSYSPPVATIYGEHVSCYIASFTMIAPKDGPKSLVRS